MWVPGGVRILWDSQWVGDTGNIGEVGEAISRCIGCVTGFQDGFGLRSHLMDDSSGALWGGSKTGFSDLLSIYPSFYRTQCDEMF